MGQKGDGRLTLVLIRGCLQFILTVSIAEAAMSFCLYSNHWVDSTISPSEILILLSSLLSIIHALLHSALAQRYQRWEAQGTPRTKIASFCSHLPRFMMLAWMVACALGLVVAARQPHCLPGQARQNFWQIGQSCRLHRAGVGLSVLAFIASCILFCSIEVSGRPFKATLFRIYVVERPLNFELEPNISRYTSTWAANSESSTSSNSLNREKFFARPTILAVTDLEVGSTDIPRPPSSIYPPSSLRCSTPSIRMSASAPGLLSHPPTFHSSYSGPFRTSSTLSTLSDLTTTTSTSSSSISSAMTKPSPLSTMRRASEPEVPVIPARFKQRSRDLSLTFATSPTPRRSATMPSLSFLPIPLPPPLSADAQIQALSGALPDPFITVSPPTPQNAEPTVPRSQSQSSVLTRPRPRPLRDSISPPPRAPGHAYHPTGPHPRPHPRPRTALWTGPGPIDPAQAQIQAHRRSRHLPASAPAPLVSSRSRHRRTTSTEIAFTAQNVTEAKRIKERMDRAIERQRGHWSRIEEEAEQIPTPTRPQSKATTPILGQGVEGGEKKVEKEKEAHGLGGVWRRLGLGRKGLGLSASLGSSNGREERGRRESLFID